MNLKDIEKLIKLLDESQNVEEIEIKKPFLYLKITKKAGVVQQIPQPTVVTSTQQVPQVPAKTETIEKKEEKEEKREIKKKEEVKEERPKENLHAIKAPMVGTFYRKPSPDAKPFVEKGDRVKKGQVVCLIEAMKVFNEIESDVDGTIVDILVEDGQPVEYGQELFLVKVD